MRGGGDQCWRGVFILHSFQTRSWRPSSAFSRMISASTEAISSCVLPASSRASSVWLPRALALGVRTSWCGSAGAGPSACRISSSRRCFASDLRDSVRLSPARSNGVTRVSRRKGWVASCYTHTASGHRRLARLLRPAARAAALRPGRGARRTAEGWRAESCRSRPRVCGPGPAPRTAAALALDEATAKGQAPLLLTKLHGLPYRSSGWSGQQGRCRGCGFPILESGPSPSCSGRRAVGNNDMSWAWHGKEQHEKQQRCPNLVAGLGLLAACERNALAKLRLLVIRELRLRLVHVFIVKLHEADSESHCQS